jgi:hypothetical protein
MIPTTTELMKPHTIKAMCDASAEATHDMAEAFRLLRRAEQRLAEFLSYPHVFPDGWHHSMYDGANGEPAAKTIEEVTERIRSDMWQYVLKQTRVEEMCSNRQKSEFDRQVSAKELPELTEANVARLLENLGANLPDMLEEAIKEVYDWLRPRSWVGQFKTNDAFKVGRKVIRSCVMTRRYGGGFAVEYHAEQPLQALDNVFHLMDGKGVARAPGNLLTAIGQAGQVTHTQGCETDYFKCKWYGKGTLHIEFKRLDLVDELNKRAGGHGLNRGQVGSPLARTA